MARMKFGIKRPMQFRKIMNNHEVRVFPSDMLEEYVDLFKGIEPLPRALGTDACMKTMNPFLRLEYTEFPRCIARLAQKSPFAPTCVEIMLFRGRKEHLPKTALPPVSCVMFIGAARTVTLERNGKKFTHRVSNGTALNCLHGLTMQIGRGKGDTIRVLFV
jgi:hypothetical protein